MANSVIIAPSILSADFAHLAGEIESVEKAGADLIHLDIMDGHFVPNITIGPPVVASIRKITKLPLDAHLMIEEPARYVDEMIHAGVDWISVHAEADVHLNRTIQHIRSQGVRAGVAINPATPISALEEVIPDVDFILVMSVNPGFGGQEFIPSALQKIRKLREKITLNNNRARIEVDGGMETGNLPEVLSAGADVIVIGSAIFKSKATPFDAVREFKGIADRHMGRQERI
ncbi:MAG: ribulose-phosphate 3-epimerase [Acidobacteriia bacterium]|nr:ribulose-phosphate 3-epimerase [Terriglobia bacterium]